MPKVLANRLTPATVRNAKPGRYGDGGGLFLLVKGTGRRSWLLRYQAGEKRRDMGLGAASGPGAVSLAEARQAAAEARVLIRDGRDPLAEKERQAAASLAGAQTHAAKAKTFRVAAQAFLQSHEAGWSNRKHAAQWHATLATYAFPHFGDVPVSEVTTRHVMDALDPIWGVKPETASRVRGRVEAVLSFATAREWREGANPAVWRGKLDQMLPKRSRVRAVKHHAALPWREIGAFMAGLRSREGLSARALEFAILTASRTSEALGARWGEIDLDGATWTVPGARMKGRREHRIPLSSRAVALLGELAPMRKGEADDLVFPGEKLARSLSSMAMLMLLRRMGRGDLTSHGFRSSFRDWAAESTSYPNEVIEMALAHSIGSKVEAAYRRGDLFEKRRSLMKDWADYCGLVEKPLDSSASVRKKKAG